MEPVVRRLLEHPTLGRLVAHHRRVEGRAAEWGEPAAAASPVAAKNGERLVFLDVETQRSADEVGGGSAGRALAHWLDA